jgi:hypothetical protein
LYGNCSKRLSLKASRDWGRKLLNRSVQQPSVGWNVDRESFMLNQRTISSLKLRASYGLTGNNQIGNYAALSTLGAANYVFGSPDALANGLYQNRQATAPTCGQPHYRKK